MYVHSNNPLHLVLIYLSGDLISCRIDVVDLEVATGNHCQLNFAAKLEDLGAPGSYI